MTCGRSRARKRRRSTSSARRIGRSSRRTASGSSSAARIGSFRSCDQIATETIADELMVTTMVYGKAERLRSYELLAQAWGL